MSWTRGLLALLAVCVLLVTGSVSCGADGAQKNKDGQSVSPVGKVLDDTDHEGRHYREVDKDHAPDVGIVVQPDTDDSWSVRLTVENFTFSPAATKAKAVSGRGVAVLFVDDRPVTTLRAPSCHLAAAYVPQGTHKVTARLYADDGTVWAVDGAPVESTADVTASEPQPTGSGAAESGARGSVGGGSGARFVTGGGASGGVSGARLALSTSGGGDVPASQPVAAAEGGLALARAGTRAGGVPTARAGARAGGGVPTARAGTGTGGTASGARLLASAGGSDATPRAGTGVGVTAPASWPVVSAGEGVSLLWTDGAASQAGLLTRAGGSDATPRAGTGVGVTAPASWPVVSAGEGVSLLRTDSAASQARPAASVGGSR
ncbi:hypothetical protein [Streptomyces sviceus]|uniref:hypothetical protein n=1 Tax=Streptomyces sviceus TaxID=285530 RepID=UPI0036E18B20